MRVEGTVAAAQWGRSTVTGDHWDASDSCQSDPSCDDETGQVTLNSGDAVFCSALTTAEIRYRTKTSAEIRASPSATGFVVAAVWVWAHVDRGAMRD